MALADLVERFYAKVFIGVYCQSDIVQVAVIHVSAGGERSERQHAFSVAQLSEEVVDFVQDAVDKTPYNYIALLSDDRSCGALPTCSLSKAKEMAPAVAQSRIVCIEEEWMNYIGEEALYRLLQRFSDLEPDAVYPPFSLMHAFYAQTMAGAHAVYLFLTSEAMSLAVVKERHLRFAEHFPYAEGAMVPTMAAQIIEALETYYGKPCCRGEFVEAVYIADGAGVGELLGKALDELLLLDTQVATVDPAMLAAETCMKERRHGV